MSEEEKQIEMSQWFSTYGALTSERILEGFNIKLSHDELVTAIKNPRSIYYQLLRVPLKNVFNGIILQQVHDYQVYAQKIFIDFLITGQSDKEESSPGAGTRDSLEEERTRLMDLGERYDYEESTHQQVIAESQAALIKLAHELQKSLVTATTKLNQILRSQNIIKTDEVMKQTIRTAMIHYENEDNPSSAFWEKISQGLDVPMDDQLRSQFTEVLKQFSVQKSEINMVLDNYIDKTNDVDAHLREFRSQFYTLILRLNELVKMLPDYRPNPERDQENLSSLNFDSKIGEYE